MASKTFSRKNHSTGDEDSSAWTKGPNDKTTVNVVPNKRQKVSEADVKLLDDIKQHSVRNYVINSVQDTTRGKSLLDQHAIDTPPSKSDEPSTRSFDREKDMSSHRVDGKNRQKIIEQSKELDSKFSHGKKVFL